MTTTTTPAPKKSIFQVIGEFLTKEVSAAEKIVASIGAFLKKEEPKVEALLAAAAADYKKVLAAVPQIEADIQAIETFILDLMKL